MSKKRGRTTAASASQPARRPGDRLLGELRQQAIAFGAFFLVSGLLFLVPSEGKPLYEFILGWNIAAAVYLGLEVRDVLRGTPGRTKRWATRQAPTRAERVVSGIGRALGIGTLSAATVLGLVTAVELLQGSSGMLRFLGVTTVVLAWLIVQASYGSYYAYLYYQKGAAGLDFPGDGEPGLVDFCYFALTVGTTFATSDVEVTSTEIRGVVIGHSLLSFAYNAALLTLAFATLLKVAPG